MKKAIFLFSIIFAFLSVISLSQTIINTKPDYTKIANSLPDFHPIELYPFTVSGKRYLRVKVKNEGASYNGHLMFRIEYLGPNFSGNIRVSKPVRIDKGQVERIDLIQLGSNIACTGENVRVTVDPLNKIFELNEKNNVIKDRIHRYNVADGRIVSVRVKGTAKAIYRSGRYIRIYPRDVRNRNRDIVSIPFSVDVQNCGGTLIRGAYLKFYYYYESKCKNSGGYIYLDKAPVPYNYESETRAVDKVLFLPLIIIPDKDKTKYCKLKKLYVKVFYDTGETGRRLINNYFIFEIRYVKEPMYY